MELAQKQSAFFQTGETKQLSFRLNALSQLYDAIVNNEQLIMQALNNDLHKSEFEAYSSELGIVLQEIRFMKKHLRKWTRRKRVKTPLTHFGSKSYVYPEPYGVTLIIAPWNYPFQLSLSPLIGAIAAGNCAVVKPSELTPHTSKIIAKIIQDTFPEQYVTVVEGGVETTQQLLSSSFQKIFFTGSTTVGSIVMEAASKQLIPVTLELGGKSPCIVHEDADLKLAAKRIAWGKFLNAGQTCIAPDYLYVHKRVKEQFLVYLKEAITELYGENPILNDEYTHIVNQNHYERLTQLLSSGQIVSGGRSDSERLVIEPTVITDINWDTPVMQDEIFGPILPILDYENIAEVKDGISKHPNPLALYLFTGNKTIEKDIIENVSFGGGCINDTVYHFASPYLPFGGVGQSGFGSYHGKASFDTFSHYKGVLKQSTRFDIPFRYPNVKNGLKKVKSFLK